ncbi:DUF1642 domain-containing protein [Lactiplantibacillus pentosus]|uniref:DUF1642 domain-containing protein n=1 Tax=Lactiplantibacillus pentosus TaxID=1589 RepID=UPI002079FF71|nr:DUF1642 domain-containing protein [Lactiplantibacillus pentosus]USJ86887.1 DUF1642 domain-containing protein [Lactiplantibacillus pentosus]
MTKIYRKTATIKAEQFDGSDEMVDKYELAMGGSGQLWIKTLEGPLKLSVDDWIATGTKGEHWAIKSDVFNETYSELPVVPKAVAAWIKKCKHDGIAIASAMDKEKFPEKVADYFRTYYTRDQWIEIQDTFARAWLDGYMVEADK